MRAVHADCGVDVDRLSYTPSLDPRPGGVSEGLRLRLSGADAATAISYSTEAGIFQARGLDAAVCGPCSIEQAHQADEYIEAAELERAGAFVTRLLDDLSN